MKTEFKKGDKIIFLSTNGLKSGVVIKVNEDNNYPVVTKIDSDIFTFTSDGRLLSDGDGKSLFLEGEIKIKTNKYIGRFADGAPAFKGSDAYYFWKRKHELDSTKGISQVVEEDVSCSPFYSTKLFAECALKEYIEKTTETKPLPDFFKISGIFHNRRKGAFIVNKILYVLHRDGWERINGQVYPQKSKDHCLKKTDFKNLVAGDIFYVDKYQKSVYGVKNVEGGVIDCVIVYSDKGLVYEKELTEQDFDCQIWKVEKI